MEESGEKRGRGFRVQRFSWLLGLVAWLHIKAFICMGLEIGR